MATAQHWQTLATLLLGGLESLQLNLAASGRLEEAAQQLGSDLQALSSSPDARGLRQAARCAAGAEPAWQATEPMSDVLGILTCVCKSTVITAVTCSPCRQLVAACTKLDDRVRSKLRRGPPAAAADARAWAAALLQHTTAACQAMEAVLGVFHGPRSSGVLEAPPAARAVAALMRCGTRALDAFCRWGLGQPDRAEQASAAGEYLAHGMAAQARAATLALLAAVSDPRWRAAADSTMLVPAALHSWMASVARGGHACLAAAGEDCSHA